ncbi:VOC family protein [Brachybacterium fresconis]|uniref:Enzyme related to lactoylglutathione lyase n=1 Tax=Brachybacterium fresconis TaxID=173363 RepID=A0ABS4YJB6_9MICO|nr:VOC family protein [Brachybacterium fresconis]MBP2408902.1 putative enzyme related to lactoylglutathione lyase [Brachybacterium fresconis]
MTGIRALTLVLEDPSAAAIALRDVAGWSIEADFGSFASLTAPRSIPLWLNAPSDGEEPSRGVVVHMVCEDVDAAFDQAVSRGAAAVREPTDMDFGERSACVRIAAAPGITIDFSRPLE